ncbi:DUF2062 domain-containing protein [Candidatus Omnitrophota bacterium]
MKRITADSFFAGLKEAYTKIFKVDDTPQKIALGLGVGVWIGILPGAGPIASLLIAFVLKLNRSAALIGSLLTNTWLTLVTFLPSIKIGSAVMELSWQEVHGEWLLIVRDFSLANILKLSALKVALPILIGYLIIGFFLGVVLYLITLVLLKRIRR